MTKITIDTLLVNQLETVTESVELCAPSGRVVGQFTPALAPRIIDRGRGPEIEGTRITVYDILDYYTDKVPPNEIAGWLSVTPAQVLAAIAYIEANKEVVMAQYQQILQRCARGNPPEIQTILDAIHAKYKVLWDDRYRRSGLLEGGDEGHPGGH